MKTFQMPHFTFRAPLNHTPCQRNNLFFIQQFEYVFYGTHLHLLIGILLAQTCWEFMDN